MVTADVVRLITQGATAALVFAGLAHVWSIALLAAIGGAASGFFAPASTGLLPDVVPPKHLQSANGLRGTAQAGGEIFGPVIAGILVAAASAGWALAIDAATFAASAVLLALMHVPARRPRAATSFLADLRDGWRAFTALRWVWTVVASITISSIFWGAWSALGPVVADRELGGAAAWGVVLGAVGAGGLLGGLVAIRSRPRRPLVLATVGFIIFSTPLGVLAAGAAVPLLAVAAFVSGVGLMVGNSLWESTLQRHVPPESLSRVSAFDWFGSMALYPLGLAIWGPVAVVLGLHETLWLAFVLLVVTTLPLLAIRDVRELRD
jgi:MFS family permease